MSKKNKTKSWDKKHIQQRIIDDFTQLYSTHIHTHNRFFPIFFDDDVCLDLNLYRAALIEPVSTDTLYTMKHSMKVTLDNIVYDHRAQLIEIIYSAAGYWSNDWADVTAELGDPIKNMCDYISIIAWCKGLIKDCKRLHQYYNTLRVAIIHDHRRWSALLGPAQLLIAPVMLASERTEFLKEFIHDRQALFSLERLMSGRTTIVEQTGSLNYKPEDTNHIIEEMLYLYAEVYYDPVASGVKKNLGAEHLRILTEVIDISTMRIDKQRSLLDIYVPDVIE